MRAVRLTAPLRLDGQLDEAVYASVPPISDFIQQEPVEGALATQKTEVWIFFDHDSIYISARCWTSYPERLIANDMRRDGTVPRNDNFSVSLDTFYDRRHGYDFETTPLGARWDAELDGDGQSISTSWNGVWEVATGRFQQGWTLEERIPFKSVRYRPRAAQIWGFQVRRWVRWNNERSYVTRIPAAFGEIGHMHVSSSATLVGLEIPTGSKNLEIKPYALSSLRSDSTLVPVVSSQLGGDWGGDVKYGITKSLTADFTYNTDFAQVEADLQQVNLTRFSLFFPEKRDFFLENAGMFSFGGAGASALAGGTGGDNTPYLFYSRRIGLAGTQAVPIVAGGRLTGRVGRFSVGALDIQADDLPASGGRTPVQATNFSVVRLKRDIMRRSSLGAIFTERSVGLSGAGTNEAYGIDGSFILTNTLAITTFWAKTSTPGRSGDDVSYRARFDYNADRYGLQLERLVVGPNFNPEAGFVRHPDMRRSYGLFQFTPRPRTPNALVRKFHYVGAFDYIENDAGRLDTRTGSAEFAIDLQNGDRANVKYLRTHEFLPAPLRLSPGVTVPPGAYDYDSVQTGYNFGPQRKKGAGNVSLEYGTFYGGHKTTAAVSNGLLSFPPHFMVEPTYSINLVRLVQGSFTTHLLGPRITYSATPDMFVSALLQYNSSDSTILANVRFRWEYRLGSALFVVWNEQRDTLAHGAVPALRNRALIIKMSHLLRF